MKKKAVLIESLRSEFQLVTECVHEMGRSFRAELEDFRSEVNGRFAIVEAVLRDHSRMLQENEKRWEKNEKRWEENERRWVQNEKHWDENNRRWAENDRRWNANEAQ